MSGIDIFAWIVLFVIIASAVVVFVVLGSLPGKVATQRAHPQAQAIQVASWLALICGFVAWPFVMTWAYLQPVAQQADPSGDEAVQQRIAHLEARLSELESVKEGGPAK